MEMMIKNQEIQMKELKNLDLRVALNLDLLKERRRKREKMIDKDKNKETGMYKKRNKDKKIQIKNN
jgi:hypothetical protein